MAAGPEHDWGFAYYVVAGFAVAFGFISGFSFGIPILLLGVYLAVRPRRSRPSARLGLVAGMGLVALVIAALEALGSPVVWTAIGCAAILTSTVAYWWLECRPAVRHGAA